MLLSRPMKPIFSRTSVPRVAWNLSGWRNPSDYSDRALRLIGAKTETSGHALGGHSMSDIILERSGSILRIQLNRPEKKNAMTSQMYETLAESLDKAVNDDL